MEEGVEERLAEPDALPGGQAGIESVVLHMGVDKHSSPHQAPGAREEPWAAESQPCAHGWRQRGERVHKCGT